ncbi:hypothetical protein [Roseateles sp. P5_D6]
MRTSDLCYAIFSEACEENSAFYRRLIEEESLDAIKDPLWKRIVALARSLSDQDKETLLAFAKQASVDAVSTVCGGIDGSTSLAGKFLSLSLVDEEGQQHAGELQEAFLGVAQHREV